MAVIGPCPILTSKLRNRFYVWVVMAWLGHDEPCCSIVRHQYHSKVGPNVRILERVRKSQIFDDASPTQLWPSYPGLVASFYFPFFKIKIHIKGIVIILCYFNREIAEDFVLEWHLSTAVMVSNGPRMRGSILLQRNQEIIWWLSDHREKESIYSDALKAKSFMDL